MTRDLHQSIAEVARAIEQLNQAFEQRADDLQKAGDPQEWQQWVKAAHAMRDSGNIYLTWARHYAGTSGPQASAESDLDDFLNEGAL